MLTLATSISYSLFTACFIFGLLALISVINTSVLLSSIFFIAASVVSGCFIIAYWSNFVFLGADLLGYFGFLFFLNVFGRLNITEVRTFFLRVVRVPFSTAFLAFRAADFALVVDAILTYYINYSLFFKLTSCRLCCLICFRLGRHVLVAQRKNAHAQHVLFQTDGRQFLYGRL